MCTILRNWLTSLAFWRNGHRFFHRSDKKGRALVMKFGRINFHPYRLPYSEVTWQRTTFQSTSFPDCLNYSSNLDCRVDLPSLTVFHACPVLEQESSKKFRCDQTPHFSQIPQFPKDVLVHFYRFLFTPFRQFLYHCQVAVLPQQSPNASECKKSGRITSEYRQRG